MFKFKNGFNLLIFIDIYYEIEKCLSFNNYRIRNIEYKNNCRQ